MKINGGLKVIKKNLKDYKFAFEKVEGGKSLNESKHTSRTLHHNPFSVVLQEQYSLEFQPWKMPVMKQINKMEKDMHANR